MVLVLTAELAKQWLQFTGELLGSILSPMLSNIYMKSLGEVIRYFGAVCHYYAPYLWGQVGLCCPGPVSGCFDGLDEGQRTEASPSSLYQSVFCSLIF